MNFFKIITNATAASVKAFFDRMRRSFSVVYRLPIILAQKSRTTVKKILDFAIGKPASAEDYVQVSGTMLSKNILIKILIVVFLCIFIMVKFVYPYLDGWLWTATVIVNSNKFSTFSGRARVKTVTGDVIYYGTMQNGSITGTGEVYDPETGMIYRGDLVSEKYEGEGSSFEDGVLVYTGSFSNNLYNGSGRMFYPDGSRRYVGDFKNGHFEGEGILYHPGGNEEYAGDFSRGLYHGVGQEFYENGNIKFDGEFSEGLYHGRGRQYYEAGAIQYEGYFERGERSGAGRLYNEDGSLLYDGNFLNGLYDGYGKLMGQRGRLLYEGGFKEGVYDGEGRLMTPEGTLLYTGGFVDGLYEGYGRLMGDGTGRTLYEGDFVRSVYHGQGMLYSNTGVLIFDGNFIMGEIDYLAYIDCTRSEIEVIFGKSQLIVYDYSFLMLQPGLDVGFLFYFGDGVEEPRVHRIVILGEQKLLNCQIGMEMMELKEIYPETYTDYFLVVEELEFKALTYMNQNLVPGDILYCAKMIEDEAFVRAFALDPEGTVIYYEVGRV